MISNRYQALHETAVPHGNWLLCLQWGYYIYADGSPSDYGYRLIHRRDNGHLNPARGQARIPTLDDVKLLIKQASAEGWGHLNADEKEDA